MIASLDNRRLLLNSLIIVVHHLQNASYKLCYIHLRQYIRKRVKNFVSAQCMGRIDLYGSTR